MTKARQDMMKTFAVDYVSDIDQTRYQGSFTIKKMSIRDLAAVGVRKAQLNGGMYYNEETPGRGVDESTDDFNNMIAQLEIVVKSAPPWWNLDNITDVGLVGAVFKEVVSFENSFLNRATKREESGSVGQGGGSEKVQETVDPGSLRALVGEKVPASLEP